MELVSAPGVINQICNSPNLSGHGTSVPKINYVAANFVGDLICGCVIIAEMMLMKVFRILLTFSACSLVGACASPAGVGRSCMETQIKALPDNCIYEEEKDAFIERMQNSHYWESQVGGDTVAYLWMEGDGCVSRRLFILSPDKVLYVLTKGDEEDAGDELYYYDGEARELKLFRNDIPRGILPSHADDSSTEVWSSLQPVMRQHQQALATAESAIQELWRQKPHARYARLVYDGYYPARFGKWMPTKEMFTVADGNWVSTANLPSVLVFRGEKVPRSAKMVGGRGYFYCDAHTGTLLGYALTK